MIYGFLVLAMILWGGNIVAAKFVIREISPLLATIIRFFLFSAALLVIIYWREGRVVIPTRSQFPSLVALGLFGTVLNNGLQFTGLLYSTAANCAVLSLIGPPVTAMLAKVLLHEKMPRYGWLGLAVSAVGVLVLVSSGSWEVLKKLSFNWGDLLLIASFLCWSGYSIVGRKIMHELSAMTTTLWASGLGTVMIVPLLLMEGFDGRIPLSPMNWAAMLYMGFGSGLVAFTLWNISVKAVGAGRAAIFINILPLAGVFFAYLLLGEEIGWHHWMGGAWIAGGVWLTTRS